MLFSLIILGVPHEVFDLVSAAASLAWLIVGLLMRSSVLEVKLIIAEIRGIIDGHVEVDELKHNSIDRHFEYTDRRVDNIEQRERDRDRGQRH